MIDIQVTGQPFDPSVEISRLTQADASMGAVVSFIGLMRDINEGDDVESMTLEHYPGMTEKSILEILREATKRWPVQSAAVVHRVGRLCPGEQIVWVGVASSHRGAAFAACEFAMDYLKTRAPFWKKEHGPEGECWVDARASDDTRAARWREPKG